MRNTHPTKNTMYTTTINYNYGNLNDLANDVVETMIENERIDIVKIGLIYTSMCYQFYITTIQNHENGQTITNFNYNYVSEDEFDDPNTNIIKPFIDNYIDNTTKCRDNSIRYIYRNELRSEKFFKEADVRIVADENICNIYNLRDSVDVWNQIIIELCNLVDSTSIDI